MTAWTPKCPRCDSRDITEKTGHADTFDDPLETTHECNRCRTAFRVTPPDAFLREE